MKQVNKPKMYAFIDFLLSNVEVNGGPYECRACSDPYDNPPHFTPACRGEARRAKTGQLHWVVGPPS